MKTTERLIKAFEKFNQDIRAFGEQTGEELVTLYEDANTTREVKADFHLCKNGVLTWTEKWDGKIIKDRYEHTDDEDIRDTLSFWKANLRRAKRYWAMNVDTLDAIQDGQIEDREDE